MGRYDDIINLPHHVSNYHKPMPMENRAAQFAPFAALSGHEDAIEETYRLTEKFKEISDEEIIIISRKLDYAIKREKPVEITYFMPDKKKTGGQYRKIYGTIKKWDEEERTILINDGRKIPVGVISEVTILDKRK